MTATPPRCSSPPLASPIRHYTSAAVFLLGTLSLIVPSGYSLGALMLFLGSAVLLAKRPALSLEKRDWLVIAAMLAYATVGMLEAWWDGQGTRGIDKPIRFVLAIPALLLVMAYPPRLAWLWGGLATGAIAAGSWAGWQKLAEGADRAGGHTYVIQFGNLSMLLGVLCLAGLGWAVMQPNRRTWMAFLLAGGLAGILGSLFSGSRGGWVGFPVMLLVLYRAYGRELSGALKLAVLGVVVAGAATVYVVPETGIQSRVHEAFEDISRYVSGESRTSSLGARFQMWKGASHLILEKPMTGWGDSGYQQGMQALADQGVIDPGVLIYEHAHNDFIDAFAKRGILGFVVLLALYLIPMRYFARGMGAERLEYRALALAGVMLCVAYIDFGLSQVFMAHNSGVMMFAFLLAILWGTFRGFPRQTA